MVRCGILVTTLSVLISVVAGCTGKTPEGKACRINLPPIVPSWSSDMRDVCPQAASSAAPVAPAAEPAQHGK